MLDPIFRLLPFLEPRRRRRGRVAGQPFPDAWEQALLRLAPFWSRLPEARRARLRPLILVFVDEKRVVGARGFEVTDEVRVVVAASAVRLVEHLDITLYDRLTTIVVYPFVRLVVPGHGDHVLGVHHRHGTVVLSWPAVLEGLSCPRDGRDTALHEFAHALDRADGRMDGAPPLRAHEDYRPWANVLGRHFEALRSGDERVVRPYGAVAPEEFFAVATEHFFERPDDLRQELPDLYDQLQRFYGSDPHL